MKSTRKRILASGLMVLGVALAPIGAMAAEPHAHGASQTLTLNHGAKWSTDDALRRGMQNMRSSMVAALSPIHENAFTANDYVVLAGRLQTEIDYVTANCHLPEAADQQLHILLEQILDGIGAMKAGSGRLEGAVKVINALNLYGAHFDHAGWQAVGH